MTGTSARAWLVGKVGVVSGKLKEMTTSSEWPMAQRLDGDVWAVLAGPCSGGDYAQAWDELRGNSTARAIVRAFHKIGVPAPCGWYPKETK